MLEHGCSLVSSPALSGQFSTPRRGPSCECRAWREGYLIAGRAERWQPRKWRLFERHRSV